MLYEIGENNMSDKNLSSITKYNKLKNTHQNVNFNSLLPKTCVKIFYLCSIGDI